MDDIEIKVGDVYMGSVNKEIFTVLFIGKRSPYYRSRDEIKMYCKKAAKDQWSTLSYIKYLIKTGGFIQVDNPEN